MDYSLDMSAQLEISNSFEAPVWACASDWVQSEAKRLGLNCEMTRRRHWLLFEQVNFSVKGEPRAVLRFARRYNAAIDEYNAD